MTDSDYKAIAPTLPRQPGVYRFVNDAGVVLYVGKAKNLFKRLSSYFGQKKDRRHKTKMLVRNADHIEYTIVETETDALLLESTLIKKFQPRYNVMLKDGKSYAYICIKKERFPRVFITRKVIKDGSTYFGPYISNYRIKVILDLIKELFPLRNCTYNLSPKNIDNNKFKVCLEYHVKNCQGPCQAFESEEEYNAKIEQIKNILKGHFQGVIRHFKAQMMHYAEELAFEKAQDIKEKLTAFENYQSKSTVVSTTIRDVDVFSIAATEKEAYVNYLKIVNGAIIHAHTQEIVKNLDDNEQDILEYTIPILRERFNSVATEVILREKIMIAGDATITIPKIGDKYKLLELSEKNVRYYLLQKQKQAASANRQEINTNRILSTLQKDLRLNELPVHIECFDNSNIQGTNPVSSCVVFRNAKPAKRDYRHYNIKTVEGPNDFASMEEVVYRRYKRLLKEGKSLPQLVIIDGGKGQLSSAMKSVKMLGLEGKMTVIGIAKQLEEIFFPDDSIPLYIDKKSESLKLIQHARNESHRFAIEFHRDQRSRNFLGTELTQIPGIGEKTAQKLQAEIGAVKVIRDAPVEHLAMVIGQAKAKVVRDYFDQQKNKDT